jgi:glycine/D-amino acid oxidase-like deaminating enzyme
MAQTVIIGSGIIGLSTAFYLADHQPGSSVHLVDSSEELFASASGYAAGFIAKDWHAKPTESLGELSFEEHVKLAEAEDGAGKWEFARSVALSYEPVRGGEGHQQQEHGHRGGAAPGSAGDIGEETVWPKWLKVDHKDAVRVIDDGEGTAIV